MTKKYTNEEFDELIKNRPFIRIGDYNGIKKKIDFKCLKCYSIFNKSPDVIINAKTNCSNCCKNKKITNDSIDKKLHKNILRLDDIINFKTKINFKCLLCNRICTWAPEQAILRKQCAYCSNKVPLTNEMIDEKLKNRNMIRVSNYIVGEKLELQCLKCNKNWKSTVNKILNRNRGCHHCANSIKYTNETVDILLQKNNKTIIRIGNIVNSKVKCSFQCLICSNIWMAVPSAITITGNGCPDCSNRKNERMFKSTLKNNNIDFKHNFLIRNIDPNIEKALNVDFYIESKNIILEYNGDQHYRPVKFGGISLEEAKENFIKQQARDKFIEEFCNKFNIKLICIDGRKYKNQRLERYIQDELVPILR